MDVHDIQSVEWHSWCLLILSMTQCLFALAATSLCQQCVTYLKSMVYINFT